MLVKSLGAEEVWEGATHGGRRVLLDDEVEREETEKDRDLRAQKGRNRLSCTSVSPAVITVPATS